MKKREFKYFCKNERGAVLAIALVMLGLFSLLGVGSIITSSVDTKISGNYRTGIQAFYNGDAGIQDAFRRLVKQTQIIQDTENPHTTTWDGCNPSPCSSSSSGFNNSFTVRHKVLNGAVIMDEFNSPLYLIRSTGTDGNAQKIIESVVKLSYNRPFTEAMHGCNGVSVASNGFTDSYNSALGTYESQVVPATTRKDDQNNAWAGDKGHIGTSNANAHISINGNAQIHGNASATGNVGSAGLGVISTGLGNPANLSGYKGTTGTLDSNAVLYKEQRENEPTTPCDPLNITNLFNTADDIVTTNNNSGIVNLSSNYPYNGTTSNFSLGSNDAFTLGSTEQNRDYYFTGFELNSNSELNVQGNVTFYINGNFTLDSNTKLILASGAKLTVYVTGNISLSSNNITNPGAPSNLMIYSSATSSSNTDYKVNISSNSNINGTIYSPNAAINISSNANVKGAIRGSYINSSSNSAFHYDESLGSTTDGSPPTGYVLVSWREVK